MDTVRIVVAGAGWWAAENHLPVLQSLPGVEVAGVCRLGREELARLQERFGIPFGTEDYAELLRLPDLDGVVVTSPHYLHYEHARAALEHGLHVLCEKPMTLHAGEAAVLAALAEARQRHFLIPYGWNYTALAAEARRQAASIGRIEHVIVQMASPLRDLMGGQGAWFAREAFCQPQMDTWSDPAKGGGYAHGQLTHALAFLYYVTGLEPAEVFAWTGASPTGADLYDAAACRFRNGATGVLSGAGTLPPAMSFQVDLRVFGAHGVLLADIERPRVEVLRATGERETAAIEWAPGAYSCVEPVRTFVELIRGGDVENRSDARLGQRVVETLDALLASSRSGAPAPCGADA